MTKKKDKFSEEYKKLQSEIIQDKIKKVMAENPNNYREAMEEIGFTWYDDDYPSEEEDEENSAVPGNDRQRLLVSYFEGKEVLSATIIDAILAEQNADTPNYPLIRKYFRAINPHLKDLILFGLKNQPTNFELLTNLTFFHEFEPNLPEVIKHLTNACRLTDDLQVFSKIALEFHVSTLADDYDALHALQDIFDEDSAKRKVVDFLISERESKHQEDIEF